MEYRFKSTFTSLASVHALSALSDDEIKVAKASLLPLRALLPNDVNPETDPDLLYFSCNGAVAGLCNANGDSVSNQTALTIYKSARNKYVSTEHDREKIVGVVLYPGLSTFGENRPLTEMEAATLAVPFNMSFAGILWKVINPMLAQYIKQQGDSTGQDALSMSWEIAFNTYDIGVGSRNLFDAQVIKADDPSFGVYDKMLRQNGGKGQDASGKDIFRIIGDNSIILGYSIVPNPAAEVKGILPIEKQKNTPVPAVEAAPVINELGEKMKAEIVQLIQHEIAHSTKSPEVPEKIAQATIPEKSEEKSITPSATGVTVNTANSMKIETLEQLEVALNKHEATAAVVDFVKAIKDASAVYEKELAAKEDLYKNADKARAENEDRSKKLQASLDEIKKELTDVRAAQEAVESNQKYQDRMASFDEEFDLDDEDRKIIASDIKDLDDTTFSAYLSKCKKLMAAKAKKKAAPKNDKDADDAKADGVSDGAKAAAAAAKAAAAAAKAAELAKAAVASLTEIDGQIKLPAGGDLHVDATLKDEMAVAFGDSIKLDGQTLAERKAKKSKK